MADSNFGISVSASISDRVDQNPITVISLQMLSVVDRVRKAISTSTSPIPIQAALNPHRLKSRGSPKITDIDKVRAYSASPTDYTVDSDEELPVFSLEEVSLHDTSNDCWTVIYDRVYDITNFLYEHPGGEDVMLEYAGRDATIAFRGVGHSKMAEAALEPYLIGILTEKERLWRRFMNLKGKLSC